MQVDSIGHFECTILILYHNHNFRKDFLDGVNNGLGAAGLKLIIKEVNDEWSGPKVVADGHLVKQRRPIAFFKSVTS